MNRSFETKLIITPWGLTIGFGTKPAGPSVETQLFPGEQPLTKVYKGLQYFLLVKARKLSPLHR